MHQYLGRVLVHLVFSTKQREPFIEWDSLEETFSYLGGTLNAIDCPVVKVGGMPDHVHILFELALTLSLSKAVEEVKRESSKWGKEHIHPGFDWQIGYGAFTVSPEDEPQVTAYIANQEEYHRTRTYQDEFREILRLHEIEWDEREVWD